MESYRPLNSHRSAAFLEYLFPMCYNCVAVICSQVHSRPRHFDTLHTIRQNLAKMETLAPSNIQWDNSHPTSDSHACAIPLWAGSIYPKVLSFFLDTACQGPCPLIWIIPHSTFSDRGPHHSSAYPKAAFLAPSQAPHTVR